MNKKLILIFFVIVFVAGFFVFVAGRPNQHSIIEKVGTNCNSDDECTLTSEVMYCGCRCSETIDWSSDETIAVNKEEYAEFYHKKTTCFFGRCSLECVPNSINFDLVEAKCIDNKCQKISK